jgi:Fic family protein
MGLCLFGFDINPVSDHNQREVTRNMAAKCRGTAFMDTPFSPKLLPLDNIDWETLVTPIADAHRALGGYSVSLGHIPNPALLLSRLTRQEAVLSTKIEGTVVTLQELLEFEADPSGAGEKRDDLQEVVNYRRALGHAVETLSKRGACLNLLKQAHSILLDGVRGEGKARGEFRRKQVYVGSYTPPTWDKVEDCMSNWEKYYHHDERDTLAQLAILHAQFELIHPFLDGNGRVGRMLIPLYLYDKGLLPSPMFYMSAYLDATRDEYYDRLFALSSGADDWQGWITYFLRAVTKQAESGTTQVREIMDLYEEMRLFFSEVVPTRYAAKALNALFSMVAFKSTDFQKIAGIPEGSTQRLLRALGDHGIIVTARERRGRRPAIYAFPELIHAADPSASRFSNATREPPASSTDD